MDTNRFDQLSKEFGQSRNRRQVVAAILGAAAASFTSLRASARSRCIDGGGSCTGNSDCCSGNCVKGKRSAKGVCAPAIPTVCNGPICGELCCPPEAVGCTKLSTPDGTKVGCLCPDGFEYRDGACKPMECPPNSNCSTTVMCGDLTSEGLCCQFPQVAFCLCRDEVDDKPKLGCCTPGIDCPDDTNPKWGGWVQGGYNKCIQDGVQVCCCEGPDCVPAEPDGFPTCDLW